jgi:hypothetical protein
MPRLLLSAFLLTACAAEVAPRADAGDPRVLPLGAVAALDGSFSEGDGLTYAWAVEPEGATIRDAESPFATLIAEAPGFYTLSLEVCDEAGRCDVAETWARVDPPSNANKVSDWGLGEFAGVESGAGAPVDPFKGNKEWCQKCLEAAEGSDSEWSNFCNNGMPNSKPVDREICRRNTLESEAMRKGFCYEHGCAK